MDDRICAQTDPRIQFNEKSIYMVTGVLGLKNEPLTWKHERDRSGTAGREGVGGWRGGNFSVWTWKIPQFPQMQFKNKDRTQILPGFLSCILTLYINILS